MPISRKRKYEYLAYFSFRDGSREMYGRRCRTKAEAWKDYAEIINDPDVKWAQGMDPFRESGIASVLVEGDD